MPSGDASPLANPPVTSTEPTLKASEVKFPLKCRAAVLTEFKKPLEILEIELDEPKRGLGLIGREEFGMGTDLCVFAKQRRNVSFAWLPPESVSRTSIS